VGKTDKRGKNRRDTRKCAVPGRREEAVRWVARIEGPLPSGGEGLESSEGFGHEGGEKTLSSPPTCSESIGGTLRLRPLGSKDERTNALIRLEV